MTHRLHWRLIGRAGRLLDSGEIDGGFPDRASALRALHAFLLTFPVRGRHEGAGVWWGRRSPDADMEVQVVLRPAKDAAALLRTLGNPDAGLVVPANAGDARAEPGPGSAALARRGPRQPDRGDAEPGLTPPAGRADAARPSAPLG